MHMLDQGLEAYQKSITRHRLFCLFQEHPLKKPDSIIKFIVDKTFDRRPPLLYHTCGNGNNWKNIMYPMKPPQIKDSDCTKD